jgi:hypothetical protein
MGSWHKASRSSRCHEVEGRRRKKWSQEEERKRKEKKGNRLMKKERRTLTSFGKIFLAFALRKLAACSLKNAMQEEESKEARKKREEVFI